MKRKEAIGLMSAGLVGLGLKSPSKQVAPSFGAASLKGNINHSACRWCYSDIPLEKLCDQAIEIGLAGIDLLKPSEWQTATSRKLKTTMANPEEFSLTDGFNNPSLHSKLQKTYAEVIDKAADAGIENVICFSGNTNSLDSQKGIDNCARGLESLAKQAEKRDVLIVMELLNSKVDHKDYQCDNTPWGVALCDKVGSPNFKLLYDIYHMQIMEGDVIATIQKYNQYFGHYHTGGVPGRNEIDETQELYYPAIMKAIIATGYKGYVAQEFIPKNEDKIASLKAAVSICDV